ncbi:MAG: hypothetical protein ACRBCS_06450 [Cellvibrionaceae bacterium]
MSIETTTDQFIERLKLPKQDLGALSFSSTNRASAVKAWAEQLPATRITHVSVLLYKALPEICKLVTPADNRLAMLEIVRPYVQHCIQGLAKGFLNQPLILPEGPMKTAVVAQALQKNMTIGYELVLRDILAGAGAKEKPSDKNLALTCHRAITSLGLLLLRGYQLYRQIPNNLWLELHTIYQITEKYDILETAIEDQFLRHGKSNTIQQAYLRILLLACARPNQMRQSEVSSTYEMLEWWSHLAKIQPVDYQQLDNLFVINLSSDMAPLYKARFSGDTKDIIRELDIKDLIRAIQQQKSSDNESLQALEIPSIVAETLIDHLEEAWSIKKQRAFERQPTENNSTIDACVGLSHLHHQMINGASFPEFLGEVVDDEIEEIDFGSFGTDPWSKSSDDNEDLSDNRIHTIHIVDTSPGGYCLEWRKDIPAQVRAGETIGLKEKGRHRWGLGIIRWVQQLNNCTRLGIQLLSPKTTPYGGAIEHFTGDFGDYLRILMLPELKAANQPATLITPFAPFLERQRVKLNNNGETQMIELTRRVFSTGAISQFCFRVESSTSSGDHTDPHQNETTAPEAKDSQGFKGDEDYDSAWED